MKLRPWTETDASFVCYMRNDPALMKWFRQDKKLTLAHQKNFIRVTPDYHGYILEDEGKPVAIIACHYTEDNWGMVDTYCTPELCYVGEIKHFKQALRMVVRKEKIDKMTAPVFAKNPLLIELLKNGFKVQQVEERAYYKEGFIDVIHLLWSKS